MINIFIVSLIVLIYIFIGYPLVLALISVVLGKSVNKKEDFYPNVSLIISAYNEENIIRQKIENSFNLDYPGEKLEIIIASESLDKTNEIVKSYKEKGVVLYHYEKREGKRATLFKTVPLAKGEIIVFSDANAMYEKDAIKKLVRNFADPRIGCVSGRLRYFNSKDSAIGKGETSYWEFDLVLKKLASRFFRLSGGVNGSIFAVRKELYDPIDKYRGDDFEIANRVEINGYGVVLEPEAVSYEDSSENARQEFKRKVRLATWNLKSTLILLKEAIGKNRFTTVFILFSHRFLRYTTPIWIMLIFISNMFLLHGNLKYFFYLQSCFFLLAFSGWIMEKNNYKLSSIFYMPFYFCMINYAALLAITGNIFGKTEMFWEKVR